MKKFTNSIFVTLLLTAGAWSSNAQELPKIFGKTASVNPENGLIRCASSEYEHHLREKYGMESREEFEAWLAPKVKQQKQKRLQKSANSTNEVITIPVVVHVIHNGDAEGSNENIAYEQVLSQITVLNQDYRRMVNTPGWNENIVGADTEIEFCLAQRDPQGNPTNGVDRVNLGEASWGSSNPDEMIENIDDNVKPVTIWNPQKYLNIWVLNFGNQSGLLGYAQFPNNSGVSGLPANNGSSNTDGVVIGYRYFGSKAIYAQGQYDTQNMYIYGRTATHEVGHYLGLLHVSGDSGSCSVNAADSNNDYCPDTPATSGYNYTCSFVDSCPSAPGVDMIENYMEYTNDACMNVFTEDQKDRMVAVLNNATRRVSLKTSDGCQAPVGAIDGFGMKNIYLYPNPAQTVVTVSGVDGELPDSLTIFNSLGQVVNTVKVSTDSDLTINTSAYANGVYMIKVDKGVQTKTFKFVKN
ncbi:M43 family zinc metalloprotease [Flavobacterium akiainvivens]|uniref:M43 family zinc metalloprotease n=1 Tax=Flavobacterium akiainvivens TaxID=1202724 RepID=UPI0006C8D3AD|nr:M43 family zinc metalloprotease [Flavobacterium akiainvivens]SFQ09334.1 Por secretion system C-terminal sorting domain-containing protein [Flavobacterium akiainvivens]